jgi:hypothetical protein
MKRIIFIVWLLVPLPLLVANQEVFNKTFGGTENDFGHTAVQTAEGGYIVCGQTDSYGFGSNLKPDMWIIKLDPRGNTEWEKTYGGKEADVAFAIQQTADLGYIVAGTTSSFGKGYPSIWIIRLDAKGDSVWSAWFEGSVVSTARSVAQTADGGYLISGSGKENILKLDKNGKREWGKKYSWVLCAVEPTSDGGCIAAGDTIYKPQNWGYIPALTVVKLDSAGNKEWSNPLGDRFLGSAFSVQQTSDGGYIVSGDSIAEKSAYDHSHYALAVKLDKQGKIAWKYFGPEYSAAQSIRQTENGGYTAAGNTLDADHGMNVLVFRLDYNGKEKWQKSYGNPTLWEYASSISQTSGKGFIVAGQTESSGAGRYDIWVLKLDENGNFEPTAIPGMEKEYPQKQLFVQNYPNPFSQSTTITFNLPEPEFVTLHVYDISGRISETLDCGYFPPGESSVEWRRKNRTGGILLFRLEAGKWSGTGRFVIQ